MFESIPVFGVFMLTFALLGGGGFVFFGLGKNGRLKRMLWPVHIVLGGVLFVVFIYLMKVPPRMFKLLIPSILLISVMNILMVRFCLSCGRMAMSQNPFARLKTCPKCNADLNNENNAGSDDLSALRPEDDNS